MRPRLRPRTTALLVTLLFTWINPWSADAAPGDLDPSFASDGIALSSQPGAASALLARPNGGIVAVGVRGSVGMLSRYTARGELDPSFAGDGILELGASVSLHELEPRPGGGMIASGEVGPSDDPDLLFIAFDDGGQLDPSFGDSGIVRLDLGTWDYVGDLEVASDGRVVAIAQGPRGVDERIVLRLTSEGALDTSFSLDGRMSLPGYRGIEVAVQPDGSVLAGRSEPWGGADVASITLLRPDGEIDPAFGDGGTIRFDVPGLEFTYVQSLDLDDRGGFYVNALGCDPDRPGCRNSLFRLTENGELDRGFGDDGVATGMPGPAVALDETGRLLVAGADAPSGRYIPTFAVRRLTPDGDVDGGFGRRGTAYAFFGLNWAPIGFPPIISDHGLASDVAVAPDGRIVLAGLGTVGLTPHLAIARLEVSRGPADADADGYSDRHDRCPMLGAKRHRGCPVADRELSVGPTPHGNLRGRLSAEIPDCLIRERVQIYSATTHHHEAKWTRVVRVRTPAWIRRRGTWSLPADAPPGRYLVRAPGHLEPPRGYCEPAEAHLVARGRA